MFRSGVEPGAGGGGGGIRGEVRTGEGGGGPSCWGEGRTARKRRGEGGRGRRASRVPLFRPPRRWLSHLEPPGFRGRQVGARAVVRWRPLSALRRLKAVLRTSWVRGTQPPGLGGSVVWK